MTAFLPIKYFCGYQRLILFKILQIYMLVYRSCVFFDLCFMVVVSYAFVADVYCRVLLHRFAEFALPFKK
jgi:hypothetical protein